MITEKDTELVRQSLEFAQANGAQKASATLTRSCEDLVATLDSRIDKVTHCEDSSLSLNLFVDGKFGNYSTNDLRPVPVRDFILKAIDNVRMLTRDECRNLPDPERCCKDAVSGYELGLMDKEYDSVTMERRKQTALEASAFPYKEEGFELISEEGEYSDSVYDCYLADTQGLSCIHRETNFDYGVEVTIQDRKGNRYSGYWWESSETLEGFNPRECARKAIAKAAGQIGSRPAKSGKYNMVVDTEVASKMVSPLLKALNGYALQQNCSFLEGSLGKKVLPRGLTILDLPHIKGECCSRLFDSEGVATCESEIISSGEVKQYFLNTYTAAKMGMSPTIESATRPMVAPWPAKGLDRNAILKMCSDGILVTDFNGGNNNGTTGDFSFGVEGYLFKNGKIVRPVSGMLVTGNFLTLWEGLICAGDDARRCMSKLIPTLAFSNVDFSGE
ncbi:MAG: TldD/PmbA family protein [Bacteroidales bacterium]|nr:TldD/PmbA family protein [Bacteroidales bacterium]